MADLSQEKVEVQGLQQAELRQRHFLSLEEFASTPAAHRQRVKRGVCTLADGRQQRWVCQSDLLVDDIPHQALLHRSEKALSTVCSSCKFSFPFRVTCPSA